MQLPTSEKPIVVAPCCRGRFVGLGGCNACRASRIVARATISSAVATKVYRRGPLQGRSLAPPRSYSPNGGRGHLGGLAHNTRRYEHPSPGAPGPIGPRRSGLPKLRTVSGNCPQTSGHLSAIAFKKHSRKFRTAYISLSLADGVRSLAEDAAPPRPARVPEFLLQPVRPLLLPLQLLPECGLRYRLKLSLALQAP